MQLQTNKILHITAFPLEQTLYPAVLLLSAKAIGLQRLLAPAVLELLPNMYLAIC